MRKTAASTSISAGTLGPLVGGAVRRALGVPLTYVPWQGVQPALVDLLGGQIEMVIGDLPASCPRKKQGRAGCSPSHPRSVPRSPPEVPTMIEAGHRDFDYTTWYAVVAPRHAAPCGRAHQRRRDSRVAIR